tara:strand:- start:8962 stop:9939 length:978 start_codon:yes stop_codon:yes gene_type:complete
MSGFGKGKMSSQLKSAISKEAKAPQAPSAAKAGAEGIFVGDFDLDKVSFGELRKGTAGDSFFPFLYDGKEQRLQLKLCLNPADYIRQPFEAGPYVDRSVAGKGRVIDPKWSAQLEMNDLFKEKMVGLEQIAQAHIKSQKMKPEFMALGFCKTDPTSGDQMPLSDEALPKWNSNIKFAKDPEKRKMYPPTFKVRVQHEPNDRGFGVPLIQKAALYEKAISKRVTGDVQDLAQRSLALVPVINLSRGIYVGGFGTGVSFMLGNALILTNKSGLAAVETDLGDFKEMDETEEELAALKEGNREPFSADPDVPGMEAFASGAQAVAAEA